MDKNIKALRIQAKPLFWEDEHTGMGKDHLVNYFAEVFCGEYSICPFEGDLWMVTGVISGIKADRHIGTLEECKIWAAKNWEEHILSAIEIA